jgi:hypothetical protein
MFGCKIPKIVDEESNRANLAQTVSSKEPGQEAEEIKVTQSYFCDRNQSKLTRQKLQIKSATLLPLRRLLLLGTEDGLIRVVS